MKNKLPISIVIPTMNRPNSLKRTIDGIMTSSSIPSQIVVVDQSFTQEDQIENKNVLNKYTEQIICTYVYQAKPSLTKARNTGLSHCEYDIIVCSDDDIDVNKDTLLNVYDAMQDESISLIAGIDENMGWEQSKLGYFAYTKSYLKRKEGHVTLSVFGRFPSKMVSGVVETEWAMGYFFTIRKSLVEKWECRWDENLISYAYPEDLDFSYSYYKKSKAENMKCIISDYIRVKHLVDQEYRIPSYKATLMYVIHREYLSYKHFKSPLSRLATRWSNLFIILNRIITRKAPMDIIKAQYLCDKYRKDIRNQKIPHELFE